MFRAAAGWPEELDAIVDQVKQWTDGAPASIAVCVPERSMVAEVERMLARAQIPAAAIGPDGPRLHDAVHVGTMHRFKGLEYQKMIIAGICEGVVPQAYVGRYRTADPLRYRREMKRARSLLFVAATRARDSVVISWHRAPSPFLPRSF